MSTGIKHDGEKVRMGLVLGGFAKGMLEQLTYHSFFDIDGAVKEVLRNIFLFYQNGDAGYLANATCLLLQKQGGYAKALIDVGKVGTFGAKKYSPDNWKQLENGKERCLDAALRNIFQYLSGEELDEEMQLPHLAAATWELFAAQEFIKTEKTKEDLNQCTRKNAGDTF